jgi:hypothetical protein
MTFRQAHLPCEPAHSVPPLFGLTAWCSFRVSWESSLIPSQRVACLLKGTTITAVGGVAQARWNCRDVIHHFASDNIYNNWGMTKEVC